MNYRKFILIIALMLLTVLISSCSDNPAVRLRYEAERQFHGIEKNLDETRALHQQLSAGESEAFAKRYAELANFCYQALDSVTEEQYPVEQNELNYLTYQASTRLSQLLFGQEKYDSCVVVLNRLLGGVRLGDKQLVSTYINLAEALQVSGNWDSALVVYNFAVEHFYPPVDKSGEIIFAVFNIPLHRYRVMNLLGDSAGTHYEYNRAEYYYRRLVADYPNSILSVASHANLARMYDVSEQWTKEVAELSAIADSSRPGYTGVMLKIADITGARLRKFDSALTMYQSLLNRADPADSTAKPGIQFKICLVKMEQKKYSEARRILTDLKRDYPKFVASTPMTQYTLARSWELDGKWQQAEGEYSLLIEKYRGSEEAMTSLLYLVDYFNEKGRLAEAKAWTERAEKYFDDVAAGSRGSQLEARALLYAADLRRRNNDWTGSAKVLLSIFEKFPQTDPGRQALVKASQVFRDKLNEPQKADSLIEVLKRSLSNLEQSAESGDLFTD